MNAPQKALRRAVNRAIAEGSPVFTEQKTTHTPGPWQQCLGSFGPYITKQTPGKDSVLAKLHDSMTPDISENENLANARLIAAAPELLAELRLCLPWFLDLKAGEVFSQATAGELAKRIEAAIAKAGGAS
jgi:hypothetical protein